MLKQQLETNVVAKTDSAWRLKLVGGASFVLVLFLGIWLFIQTKPAQALKRLTLDYAYYNPSSLVLKRFGWLEESFKQQGIEVKWVQSAGSNRALQYLNGSNTLNYLTGESVQFGSTAGLSAVLARAKGDPIKAVYIYSRPEWAALVVPKNSLIQTMADLRGKKIAATKGTDPYLFLLRALDEAGIQQSEVEIVNLKHAQGRVALKELRVDAWAGLDPHMAASELEEGNRLIYRNITFNTYGFLNVSEAFAHEHPDAVTTVIENYERARNWILAHQEDAVKLISEEASMPIEVARLQLQRNNLDHPQIGQEQIEALAKATPLLVRENLVMPGVDVAQTIRDLIDPSFSRAITR